MALSKISVQFPPFSFTSMAGHGIANCIRPQRLVCGGHSGRVRTYSGTPGTKLSTHIRPPFLGTPVVIPFASVLSLNLH